MIGGVLAVVKGVFGGICRWGGIPAYAGMTGGGAGYDGRGCGGWGNAKVQGRYEEEGGIPAYAGMTWVGVGMTGGGRGNDGRGDGNGGTQRRRGAMRRGGDSRL